MPEDKQKDELARDVGESSIERFTAEAFEQLAKVEGVGELAEVAPWIGPVVKAVKWGLARRDSQLCFDFFRDLADLMGKHSAQEAANHIGANLEHDWAREGVARGIRAILDAVDEDVRRCIAVLVADYFRRQAKPDLLHKRMATLLLDSDSRALTVLIKLLDLYPATDGLSFVLLAGNAEDHYFGQAWFVPLRQADTRPERTALVHEEQCQEVGALLIKHGFASLPTGFASSTIGYDIAIVPNAARSGIAFIRDCLRTAGIGAARKDA